MKSKKTVFKIILPLLIIVVGIVAFRVMQSHKKAPLRSDEGERGVLVQVMEVKKEDHQVLITATGNILPRREASITSEISGKVVHVAPAFVVGGFFREGELMVAIEDTDYLLAVEKAEAAVAKMEFEVTSVQARAMVAKAEWKRLNSDNLTPDNPLVLFGPQLKDAKANLKSTKAALKQAQLNLERTQITAPFNCRIRSEQIGLGQYVKIGSTVGTVGGTDQAEVIVPLAMAEMRWLSVPKKIGERGSRAVIELELAGEKYSWPGWVARSLGEVDQVGKMARLAVVVEDPFCLHNGTEDGRPDLPIGMFVDVVFYGTKLSDIVSLPRKALRSDNTVWLLGPDNRLQVVKVELGHGSRSEELVTSGLETGDRVVLTRISGAVTGTLLKVIGE